MDSVEYATVVNVGSALASEGLVDDNYYQDPRFQWGIFGLVGHGKVRSSSCGEFRRFMGCLGRDGAHDKVDVYGHDFRGKMAVQKTFMRCYSPRCPTCAKTGHAKREAERGTARLLELGKKFGLIEHGTASPSLGDADKLLRMDAKEFKRYWRYMEERLFARGIIGGYTMFHPARYDPVDGWHWSPHWHFLSVVVPSYGQCRRCTNRVCKGVGKEYERCKVKGFEAVTRRAYGKDGFIVKIFGQRKKVWKKYYFGGEKVVVSGDEDNIYGTLFYQLTHAGFVVSAKRASVGHWFGVASYRKLKVSVEKHKQLCPICDDEFVQLRRLRSDFELPFGSAIHIIDLCGSDGEPRFIEAFGAGYE